MGGGTLLLLAKERRIRECPETIVLYTCPFVDIANKVRTYDTLSVHIAEASQLSFKLFRLFIYFLKKLKE